MSDCYLLGFGLGAVIKTVSLKKKELDTNISLQTNQALSHPSQLPTLDGTSSDWNN
jgi:hypothetical protein